MLKFNVMERLHTMRVPTLMVAGAADGLLHLNLRDFEKLKLASLHVFSRVGHLIPREVRSACTSCAPQTSTDVCVACGVSCVSRACAVVRVCHLSKGAQRVG
jgi:hypothetical protein